MEVDDALELSEALELWPTCPKWWKVASAGYSLHRVKVSLFLVAAVAAFGAAEAVEPKGTVLAVFAHPDDERVIGPLLSKLAREGRSVHLAIATDGSKGVRDYAGIPAGIELAAARLKEAECSVQRLRLSRLHMIGMEDGSLGTSMATLAELRTRLSAVVSQVGPDMIITFGPEGGTGHPDHRLVGNVVTEIVQADRGHQTINLFYASLPAERLRSAPQSTPRVSGVSEALLTVRVPVQAEDIAAAHRSFGCHATQYTTGEMRAINRTLVHVWNGVNYLRPWNGSSISLREPF